MATAADDSRGKRRLFGLCLFWQPGRGKGKGNGGGNSTFSSSASSTRNLSSNVRYGRNSQADGSLEQPRSSSTVSSVARSLLPARRRLRLDPSKNLYFPCKVFSFASFEFPVTLTFCDLLITLSIVLATSNFAVILK
ncbi:hypothetical protein SAY86_016583 [Trapa natans]|uniref:Uncharacterized protein n=1 Tax=Trapa natans TaxID=22666 RepID=A0AAN7LKE7_TRANT|nr:hypothetical protein SAY86_016583 [Trapa natans]